MRLTLEAIFCRMQNAFLCSDRIYARLESEKSVEETRKRDCDSNSKIASVFSCGVGQVILKLFIPPLAASALNDDLGTEIN